MTATYQTNLKGRLNEVPVMNSLFWATPSADNSFGEAIDVNDGVNASSIIGDYLACCPDDYVLDSIETRGVVVAGGGSIATPTALLTGLLVNGERTGEVASNQDGPMLSFFPAPTSGLRARVNKIFFPGVTDTDATADAISGALVTAIESFATSLAAGFTYGGPGPAQWKAIIRDAGIKTIKDVVAYAAETWVASQNRRRPRH